jgi:2-polyprenyl-6-hydroxyphenyl methylase/3-demethylubiquinone-9 3-methyltransferase
MDVRNAIDWHTQIATNFDKKYSSSKNFKERYSIWTEVIDKYSNKNAHVLDVGCGSGVFSFYLAKKNKTVTALDGSTEMLKICQKKKKNIGAKNIDFINCNIDSLGKHTDEKADMIVCSSVLEYIEDLDESLEIIRQSMNKNSRLILSMPNKQSIYRKIEPLMFNLFGRPKYYKYVKNVCMLKEMEKRLKKFGFSILESKFYGETPFLSKVFRKIGVPCYSDNLFITVAQLS